jgi:hypothetical protein
VIPKPAAQLIPYPPRPQQDPPHVPGAPWDFYAAGEFIGLAPTTIAKLAKSGLIKAIWIGRRRFISDSEMTRILAEGVPLIPKAARRRKSSRS